MFDGKIHTNSTIAMTLTLSVIEFQILCKLNSARIYSRLTYAVTSKHDLVCS